MGNKEIKFEDMKKTIIKPGDLHTTCGIAFVVLSVKGDIVRVATQLGHIHNISYDFAKTCEKFGGKETDIKRRLKAELDKIREMKNSILSKEKEVMEALNVLKSKKN